MRNLWFLFVFIATLLLSCASFSGRVSTLAAKGNWKEVCLVLKSKNIVAIPQYVYDIAFDSGQEAELSAAASNNNMRFDFVNSFVIPFATASLARLAPVPSRENTRVETVLLSPTELFDLDSFEQTPSDTSDSSDEV